MDTNDNFKENSAYKELNKSIDTQYMRILYDNINCKLREGDILNKLLEKEKELNSIKYSRIWRYSHFLRVFLSYIKKIANNFKFKIKDYNYNNIDTCYSINPIDYKENASVTVICECFSHEDSTIIYKKILDRFKSVRFEFISFFRDEEGNTIILKDLECKNKYEYFIDNWGELRNIVSEIASGYLLIFMDRDIDIKSNIDDKIISFINSKDDVACASFFNSNTNDIIYDLFYGEVGGGLDKDVMYSKYIPRSFFIIKKHVFISVLGFDVCSGIKHVFDLSICDKINQNGYKSIIFMDKHVYFSSYLGLSINELRNDAVFIERYDYNYKKNRIFNYSNEKKNVVIYTPYNITPGGGERFILSIAASLQHEYNIHIAPKLPTSKIRILQVSSYLRVGLEYFNLISLDHAKESNIDIYFSIGNECYPQTDGLGKENYFICQFPFPFHPDDFHLKEKLKENISSYRRIIVYSEFVKHHLTEKLTGVEYNEDNICVINPPVSIIKDGRKSKLPNRILSVGRFFEGAHCKRHDFLIDSIRILINKGIDLELHIAGSLDENGPHVYYYNKIKEMSYDLPVYFHVNCSSQEIKELYESSSIYWHATGCKSDLVKNPHETEHFGISVVEAMSARCIPIIFSGGGMQEIIVDGKNGFLFKDMKDLCDITMHTINLNQDEKNKIANLARESSLKYSDEEFKNKILTFVSAS